MSGIPTACPHRILAKHVRSTERGGNALVLSNTPQARPSRAQHARTRLHSNAALIKRTSLHYPAPIAHPVTSQLVSLLWGPVSYHYRHTSFHAQHSHGYCLRVSLSRLYEGSTHNSRPHFSLNTKALLRQRMTCSAKSVTLSENRLLEAVT